VVVVGKSNWCHLNTNPAANAHQPFIVTINLPESSFMLKTGFELGGNVVKHPTDRLPQPLSTCFVSFDVLEHIGFVVGPADIHDFKNGCQSDGGWSIGFPFDQFSQAQNRCSSPQVGAYTFSQRL
jgi:hypothetical protein